jgi:integrase
MTGIGSRQERQADLFDREGHRKYINAAERKAFAKAVESCGDAGRKAFCLTLYHTGCRVSEGLNLIAERVDLSGKAVVLETLKRRKRGVFRSVPIPEELLRLLQKLMEGKAPAAKLWEFSRPTAYRLITARMALAGITGKMANPKGLRHGFAIACIQRKIPLTTVKKWLGHARLETTEIYLNFLGEEERELAQRLWKPAKTP